MASPMHVYEIFIRAPRERVWQALTDPDYSVRYFHRTRVESTFRPGEKYRYVIDASDTDAVEGVIEIAEPPARLVMTWRVLYDAEMAEEPPSRVEWTLTDANDDGSVTRVTLRHVDLALSPKTWANVKLGWVAVIDGMKTLLETGDELPQVDAHDGSDSHIADGTWHRHQAVAANNATWELLDGRSLDDDEQDELVARAHTAAYHWRRAEGSTVVNMARAAWLVSRAYATVGAGELALSSAQRCARLTDEAGDAAADFDVAYAHEALARSLACLGRIELARAERELAGQVEIQDEQDASILGSDLLAGPWFGLDD